jgi:hypothetical protein
MTRSDGTIEAVALELVGPVASVMIGSPDLICTMGQRRRDSRLVDRSAMSLATRE